MNRLESSEAKLLLIASRLPGFEKSVMKEMILGDNFQFRDNLINIMMSYEANEYGVEKLKSLIIRCVVQHTVQLCRLHWTELFADLSTEKVKLMVNSAESEQFVSSQGTSLTYGEIDFYSFACILEAVGPQKGDVFADLGHGTGRAIICAYLLYGSVFQKIQGIEILPVLFNASKNVLSACNNRMHDSSHIFGEHKCDVELQEGDILSSPIDWTAAG